MGGGKAGRAGRGRDGVASRTAEENHGDPPDRAGLCRHRHRRMHAGTPTRCPAVAHPANMPRRPSLAMMVRSAVNACLNSPAGGREGQRRGRQAAGERAGEPRAAGSGCLPGAAVNALPPPHTAAPSVLFLHCRARLSCCPSPCPCPLPPPLTRLHARLDHLCGHPHQGGGQPRRHAARQGPQVVPLLAHPRHHRLQGRPCGTWCHCCMLEARG